MRHLGGAMLSSLLVFPTADYLHPRQNLCWSRIETSGVLRQEAAEQMQCIRCAGDNSGAPPHARRKETAVWCCQGESFVAGEHRI